MDNQAVMANADGYCLVCLCPGHTAEACKNATNPKYVCSMKGCQTHHHPSLHGNKDKYVTSNNILMATSMRDDNTEDISAEQGPTGVTKFESEVTTKLYLVELMDKDGNRKIVKAFSLDSIIRMAANNRKAQERV